MGFREIRFPTEISYGSQGGPQHDNEVIRTRSGARTSVAKIETPRMVFDAKEALKNKKEIGILLDFVRIVGSSQFGFRFFDHVDHTTAENHRDVPQFDDVEIGVGDGVQTQFQLFKEYEYGGFKKKRTVTKPIHGATVHGEQYDVLIAIDGVQLFAGWTVDTTTGIVTFTVPPATAESITAGFAFDVPAAFGEEIDDGFLVTLNEYENEEVPSVPIYEIPNQLPVEDEFYFGNAVAHGAISANVVLSPLAGRLHEFEPSLAGLKVILPDYLNLPPGGPWYLIVNNGFVDLEIEDHLGGAVATIHPTEFAEIWLGFDNLSQKIWRAF